MEDLNRLARARPDLDALLKSGVYSMPELEPAAYSLLFSAVNHHKQMLAREHAKKDSIVHQLAKEDREETARLVFEEIKRKNLAAASYDAVKHHFQLITTRDVLEDHLAMIREEDIKEEEELEEDKVGYIIVLGFDKSKPGHAKSINKERYHGREERRKLVAPEEGIAGSISSPTTREKLLGIAYRDGAILFDRRGEFVDGRIFLQGTDISEIPPLTERFPGLEWPPEFGEVTDHGLHPKAGTRNLSCLGYSWRHPDMIVYNLSTTGGLDIKRYHAGALTFSTDSLEGAVAKHLLSVAKEEFMFPQHI